MKVLGNENQGDYQCNLNLTKEGSKSVLNLTLIESWSRIDGEMLRTMQAKRKIIKK